MAQNKKPRKAYKPKRIVKNPIGYMSKMTESEKNRDQIYYRLALSNLQKGQGTFEDCNTLTFCLNCCASLCLQHFGGEGYEMVAKCQSIQNTVNNRAKAQLPAVYTTEEFVSVRNCLDYYDSQVDIMSPKDMLAAKDLVEHTLSHKKFVK